MQKKRKGQLWKKHVNSIVHVLGTLGPQSTAKRVNYCCENQSVWDQNRQASYFALIKTSSVRLSFSLEIHAWTGVTPFTTVPSIIMLLSNLGSFLDPVTCSVHKQGQEDKVKILSKLWFILVCSLLPLSISPRGWQCRWSGAGSASRRTSWLLLEGAWSTAAHPSERPGDKHPLSDHEHPGQPQRPVRPSRWHGAS